MQKKPSLRKHGPLQTVLSSLIGCANGDDVAARLFNQDAKFRREIFLVLLCLHSRQWDGQDEGLSGYQNWETVSYRVCDEDPKQRVEDKYELIGNEHEVFELVRKNS